MSIPPGEVSTAAGPAATTVAGLSRLHSRNSSDSSGYHELTLSGAESPEAARVPQAFKTSIDTTSIESGEHGLNGDAPPQETPAAAPAAKPAPAPSTKKRKAPPPPPKGKGNKTETRIVCNIICVLIFPVAFKYP